LRQRLKSCFESLEMCSFCATLQFSGNSLLVIEYKTHTREPLLLAIAGVNWGVDAYTDGAHGVPLDVLCSPKKQHTT
jgi:hypothetical protein